MRSVFCLLAAGAAVLLASCGSPSAPESDPDMVVDLPAPEGLKVASTTPYPVEACRAAIATIMGRNPATIKGRKIEGGLIHVSYIRPDDGKRWQARCRIDDANHLTWAAFDAFGDGQQGRWRDEDAVEFTVKGKAMHVAVSTGGELVSEDTFPMAKLRL